MSAAKGLPPDELLERIAHSLRTDIGPAVGAAYPKTQAFMASVVLEKLAKELRLAGEHAARNRADAADLVRDLDREIAAIAQAPGSVREALEQLRRDLDAPALTRIVEALYATRNELGDKCFAALLTRVRAVLRARIDRALEYAA
jgi:hypothetical protein